MSETHAEKVSRIAERVRQALLGYGLQGIIVEDVVTMVSQIVHEELP